MGRHRREYPQGRLRLKYPKNRYDSQKQYSLYYVTRLTFPVDRIDSLAVQIIDNMEVKSSEDSLLFLIQDNLSKIRTEITSLRKNAGNSSVK